jgi:hypothetical protein
MKVDGVPSSLPLAVNYAMQLEALTAEVGLAMDAFGENNLCGFEESVARQQELCANLGRLLGQMEAGKPVNADRVQLGVERDLARRIRRAAESLQACQRTYVALLKHAGDSSRMFDGLCRSYNGPIDQSTGMYLRRSSWSC